LAPYAEDHDPLAIAGFHSHCRNQVRYQHVEDFAARRAGEADFRSEKAGEELAGTGKGGPALPTAPRWPWTSSPSSLAPFAAPPRYSSGVATGSSSASIPSLTTAGRAA